MLMYAHACIYIIGIYKTCFFASHIDWTGTEIFNGLRRKHSVAAHSVLFSLRRHTVLAVVSTRAFRVLAAALPGY